MVRGGVDWGYAVGASQSNDTARTAHLNMD